MLIFPIIIFTFKKKFFYLENQQEEFQMEWGREGRGHEKILSVSFSFQDSTRAAYI